MKVENQFPVNFPTVRRIAVIGEAPSQEDASFGKPFIGHSGRLLESILATFQVPRAEVFLGNVLQYQAPHGDVSKASIAQQEESFAELQKGLARFKPNITILLGNAALDAAKAEHSGVSNERGSLFLSDTGLLPEGHQKCLATYHPAFLLRSWNHLPFVKHDFRRAVQESESPILTLPFRRIEIAPSLEDVLAYFAYIKQNDIRKVSIDIEGYADHSGITEFGFAHSKDDALVIPFYNASGQPYWSPYEEAVVWDQIAQFCYSDVVKIAQNALYELFVCAWRHRLIINNLREDTMLGHWELFPEFEKNLGLQVSLYTREPYYKEERVSDSWETKQLYNGKDCVVTYEIHEVQERQLNRTPASAEHYRFNCDLLYPLTYMMLRGCKFDKAKADQVISETQVELEQLQSEINHELGFELNVKSSKQKQELLYDHWKYTPYKREGRSTQEAVLLRLYQKYKNETLRKIIRAIKLRTRISDTNKLVCSPDGRIRCSYNHVGTVTGRLASSKSNARILVITGKRKKNLVWLQTGTNLQNVTKLLRACFTADLGKHFWQYDLAGADAWTVACDLAALGEPAMLDDLLYGIKPSKVLLLMLNAYNDVNAPGNPVVRAERINRLDRAELKRQCDLLDTENDWRYLCMKRVQHGTNYNMQPPLLSEVIFKDSDGAISLPPKDAGLYQYFYKLRYKTDKRTAYIEKQLKEKGFLVAACGIRRQFFDIRYGKVDSKTLRAALSFEPQANTSYITNKGLHALYYDPSNRLPNGALRNEPILQIHDALCGQFRQEETEEQKANIKRWFTHPLKIHGVEVTIPSDGGYGTDWKNLPNAL